MRGLSKTTFKQGLNCARALWLEFNDPAEANAKFGEKESLSFGEEVGLLARDWMKKSFGSKHFVLADKLSPSDPDRLAFAARTTSDALSNKEVSCIAEATFAIQGGHKCQCDFLIRDPLHNGWKMVEVKSRCNIWSDKAKTKIAEEFINDVSFQTWVLLRAGINVTDVYILHPNSYYRLHGELRCGHDGYFLFEDVTAQANRQARTLSKIVVQLKAVVYGPEPQTKCGAQCASPNCPFLGHCLPEVNTKGSIIELGGMQRKKQIGLIQDGIITKDDLLRDGSADLLSAKTRKPLPDTLLTQCAGRDYVAKSDLRAWLGHLEGKTLYFLDFETLQTAVPRFEGDKPYEQVPTQYSLHVVSPDGSVKHTEYLAQAIGDPWRGVAEALCGDIPKGATTVAYNKVFESERIKAMAAKFPDLASHLLSIVRDENPHGTRRDKRDLTGLGLVDLIDPFKQAWVYRPAMAGSKSIKWVLPALFPDDPALDYHALESHGESAPLVQNGTMAIEAFSAMANMDADTMAATRENLLRYCELDTWAMVKIWLWLRAAAGFPPLPKLSVDAPLPRNS